MPGGVGAYTAEVARALVGRGWQVSVLTSPAAKQVSPGSGAVTVYPEMGQWRWNLFGAGVRWARMLNASWLHVQYQTAAFGMHPAINLAPAWWQRQGLHVAWTYHD